VSGKVVVFPDLEFVCLFACMTAKKLFFVINIRSDLRLFVVEVFLLQAHSPEGGGAVGWWKWMQCPHYTSERTH